MTENNGLKASFTVEAALIMPLIMGITLILLEYGLMLHDRVVALSAAEEACDLVSRGCSGMSDGSYDFGRLSGSRLLFGDADSVVSTVRAEITESLKNRLLFSEIGGIRADRTPVGQSVEIRLIFRRVPPFLSGTVDDRVTAHETVFEREKKTRLTSVIKEIGEGLSWH